MNAREVKKSNEEDLYMFLSQKEVEGLIFPLGLFPNSLQKLLQVMQRVD